MTLIDHLERFLGPIQEGWSHDATGSRLPFQVVRFARGPTADSVSFATLGLSREAFHSTSSGKSIHQELLMVVPSTYKSAAIPDLLQSIASATRASGHALLRGDVIGPRGPILPGATAEALYVAIPVYFPKAFHSYREADREIVMSWLVPITADEAGFIKSHGWKAFEGHLDEGDVDLIDITRRSALVPN
jgi:Suppressor of fused protein (SUFU)